MMHKEKELSISLPRYISGTTVAPGHSIQTNLTAWIEWKKFNFQASIETKQI